MTSSEHPLQRIMAGNGLYSFWAVKQGDWTKVFLLSIIKNTEGKVLSVSHMKILHLQWVSLY